MHLVRNERLWDMVRISSQLSITRYELIVSAVTSHGMVTHSPGYHAGCAHGVYIPLRTVWPINARIFLHGTKNIYSGRV